MNTTQHRFTIVIYFLTIVLTATAQSNKNARQLQKGIETFLASDGLMKSTIHDGQGIYQHIFKIPYGENWVTNDKGMPRIMDRLERAFASTQAAASSSFAYNIDEKVTPIKAIRFIWNNSYRKNIVFYYNFDDSSNCRFSTYTDKDGTRHFYGLVWNFVEFTDKDDKPYKSIDGYILELHGKHWSYLNMNDDCGTREIIHDGMNGNAAPDTLDFAKLREKISSVSKMYEKAKTVNDEDTQDALAYVVYRLSKEYKGAFDAAQFKSLSDMFQNMFNNTDNNSRKRLMIEAFATFSKAIKNDDQLKKINMIENTSSIYYNIMLSEEQRWELFKQYEWIKAKLGPLYECKIEGNTTLSSEYVVIKPMNYDDTRYRYRTHDGRFMFNEKLPIGQFARISEGNENAWWVITDSVPLTIDMKDGKTEGSELNKRFLQYQIRIKRMAGELRKYMSNSCILTPAGYNAIMDSIRMIGQEAIRENQNNVIPAFFLAEDYHNMPYEQLEKAMDSNKVYANHTTMQPVWRYFEGVNKRLPGRKYIDIELQDTAGVKHSLSEYFGKGNYVLLHFWSTQAWWSRRELKYVKNIVRENKGKPLTVVGISMNQDENDWKEYITARALNWTHLSSPDEWNGNAATAYGVTALPTSVLIAPDGTIVAQDLRNTVLQEKIRELLQEQ